MKYFSMFSGIGGFEHGIQRAFDKQSTKIEQDRQGWNGIINEMESDVLSTSRTTPLCIGFSEVDKYAIQIYKKHFKEHKDYGDCTRIKWEDVEDFEMLVGGFPCQAFSIAGKRGGFKDTRGTLFFEIARCIREKQPRLFVLENVKGLLSHDKGNTFLTILTTLDELWYDLQWQVLNSKNFGVPQNRERVFIVGHLRGTSRPEVFPIEGTNSKAICKVMNEGGNHSGGGVFDEEGICPTLTSSEGGGGVNNQPKVIQLNSPKHSNDRVYSEEGISPTLNTMQGGRRQPFIPEGARIRRLTPKECERLQGFPDGWTEGISYTQRYKCLGNAVTVNVIEAIMSRLLTT